MNIAASRPAVDWRTSCRPTHTWEHESQGRLRRNRLPALGNGQPNASEAGRQKNDAEQQAQHQHTVTSRYPLIWCQGLLEGTFVEEVQATFPKVDWQASSVVQVLYYGLPAAAVAVLANTQLAKLLQSSSSSSSSSAQQYVMPDLADGPVIPTVADLSSAVAASLDASAVLQQSLLHLSQEAVFAAAMPLACWLALGDRVVACRWDGYWALQTLFTCAVLFPLADPVLYDLWQPVAEAVSGHAPDSPLVTTLHQAASTGNWASLGVHCLTSGALGPIWEEVFWRGFFLTALTKVLPIPACVTLSSLNFAALHLSVHNFLPLFVLSAGCDCLYLRSAGNLLAPLLLHGLWNISQVLQIALMQKDTFV